jgi:O-antigen/teichoic acid export membrane protein
LQNVLAAAVFARILAAILLGRSALKVLEIRSILPPQLGVAKGLFNFGGWMLIASVTNMIAESLDRVMLGTSLGARFVTYYTVPQNLVTRLNIVPTALVRTLFPRLSAVGRADADTITQQSLEFLNGVFTPVALVAMLVLEPFLHLWVGNEIATVAAPVGRIMIVAVWLVGQANVTRILIQSQVNPATAAQVGLFELPLFAGALWFGITHFGLTGAAVAVAGRALFDYAVLLRLSAIRARQIALDMLAHLAFLLASLWLASFLPSLALAIVAGLLMVGANVAWSITMTPALRDLARSLLLRLNPRKSA